MSSTQDENASLAGITNPLIDQIKSLHEEKKAQVVTQEVALATAIVLLEVASCDSHLTQHERAIIHNGLKYLFGASDEAIKAIIAQAKNHLNSLRGSSSFAALLKDYLDPESKKIVAKLIDDLIKSDGAPQGFETYLRQRFYSALGIVASPGQVSNN